MGHGDALMIGVPVLIVDEPHVAAHSSDRPSRAATSAIAASPA